MFCYDRPSLHFPFIFVPECFSELRFNVINLIEEEDDDVILEKMNFCHILLEDNYLNNLLVKKAYPL